MSGQQGRASFPHKDPAKEGENLQGGRVQPTHSKGSQEKHFCLLRNSAAVWSLKTPICLTDQSANEISVRAEELVLEMKNSYLHLETVVKIFSLLWTNYFIFSLCSFLT